MSVLTLTLTTLTEFILLGHCSLQFCLSAIRPMGQGDNVPIPGTSHYLDWARRHRTPVPGGSLDIPSHRNQVSDGPSWGTLCRGKRDTEASSGPWSSTARLFRCLETAGSYRRKCDTAVVCPSAPGPVPSPTSTIRTGQWYVLALSSPCLPLHGLVLQQCTLPECGEVL